MSAKHFLTRGSALKVTSNPHYAMDFFALSFRLSTKRFKVKGWTQAAKIIDDKT